MTLPAILPPTTHYDPARHPGSDAVRAWQAHVDAGRIGNRQPTDPEILANLLATDALFRSCRNPRPVRERR